MIPKSAIFVIFAFLVGIYVYTFIQVRKRNRKNKNSISSVEAFHQKYDNLGKFQNDEKKEDILDMDYLDKETLHRQIQNEIHQNDNSAKSIKKIVFKF